MRPALCLAALIAAGAACAEEPFRLGVQTHFEQGWEIGWSSRAGALGATLLRDEIGWSEAETSAGVYDFATADAYMDEIAAQGMQALIVFAGANPLHDGGNTPHTAEGRAALAAYLDAMLTRYAGTVTRLEIGNEVNAGESVSGPFKDDPARALAAMARDVSGRLSATHPEVQILCAGTNTISLGFLRDFFRYGGLEACDAISVHPYRAHPENVDLEIARLRALMREMGGEKPVHVTEFGKWVDDPAQSPDYMLKMVAMLGASGVAEAYWYALVDEPWWPNMGLYTQQRVEKPAAHAFRFLQERLLPLGRPVSRNATRSARVYEFGDSGRGFVLWGAGQPVKIRGEAQAFDATGQPVALPERLGDSPVVLLGRGIEVRVDGSLPVADSLYQFNTPPWSYYARRPFLGLTPLEMRDWEWTSFRGAPDLSPLSITDDWITTARFADGPYHAVERFTAAAPGRYRVEGKWWVPEQSEPSEIIVRHNGEDLARGGADSSPFLLKPRIVTLAAGDRLDFEVAPAGPTGAGSVQRRIRVQGPLPAE